MLGGNRCTSEGGFDCSQDGGRVLIECFHHPTSVDDVQGGNKGVCVSSVKVPARKNLSAIASKKSDIPVISASSDEISSSCKISTLIRIQVLLTGPPA